MNTIRIQRLGTYAGVLLLTFGMGVAPISCQEKKAATPSSTSPSTSTIAPTATVPWTPPSPSPSPTATATPSPSPTYDGPGNTITVNIVGNGSTDKPQTTKIPYSQTSFSVTATASAHNEVDSVSGCNVIREEGTTTYTSTSIYGDCTITVTFKPIMINVTVNVYADPDTDGTILKAGSLVETGTSFSVQEGTPVVFTALPAAGKMLSTPTGCNGVRSGNTYTIYPADSGNFDMRCGVDFSFEDVKWTVTVTTTHEGSAPEVTTFANLATGVTKTVSVGGDTYYKNGVVAGTCGGAIEIGGMGERTYITNPITGDCTITVYYEAIKHAVLIDVVGNGMIDQDSVVMVRHRGVLEINATPSTGNELYSISGCGGTQTGNYFVTEPIESGFYGDVCTISVKFISTTPYAKTLVGGTCTRSDDPDSGNPTRYRGLWRGTVFEAFTGGPADQGDNTPVKLKARGTDVLAWLSNNQNAVGFSTNGYWLNGVWHTIPNNLPANCAEMPAMMTADIHNGQVYAAGFCKNAGNGEVPVVYTPGSGWTSLATGAYTSGLVYSMTFNGDTPIYGGNAANSHNNPAYWVGTELHLMAAPENSQEIAADECPFEMTSGQVYDIAVSGGKVFAIGYMSYGQATYNNGTCTSGSHSLSSAFWVDGQWRSPSPFVVGSLKNIFFSADGSRLHIYLTGSGASETGVYSIKTADYTHLAHDMHQIVTFLPPVEYYTTSVLNWQGQPEVIAPGGQGLGGADIGGIAYMAGGNRIWAGTARYLNLERSNVVQEGEWPWYWQCTAEGVAASP